MLIVCGFPVFYFVNDYVLRMCGIPPLGFKDFDSTEWRRSGPEGPIQ